MSKKKPKKSFKNKKRKSKNTMGNQLGQVVPSLSKQQASSNWLNFLKSNGMNQNLKKFLEKQQQKSVNKKPFTPEITKVLSIDCEMVADVNNEDMLARVSIVNYNLQCVYDKFVKPTFEVGDYRTRVSGIREENLREAADFELVRKEVVNILSDKILVGHALYNDLKALKIKHPSIFIRDTSIFPPFRKISNSKSPSLRKLAKHYLNESIQDGEHCSVEDAKTAMKLYKKFNQEWELSINNAISSRNKEAETLG